MTIPSGPGSTSGCRVVARLLDGRVLKGTTHDFAPNKTKFHLVPWSELAAATIDIPIGSLKALFFVKSFDGDAKRKDDNSFDNAHGNGRKVLVTFQDGELIAGFVTGFSPDKPGFFLVPADPDANNERIYVVRSSMRRVEWVTGVAMGQGATGR